MWDLVPIYSSLSSLVPLLRHKHTKDKITLWSARGSTTQSIILPLVLAAPLERVYPTHLYPFTLFACSITLILVADKSLYNQRQLEDLLETAYDGMVMLFGLDDLILIKNVERFKRDIRVSGITVCLLSTIECIKCIFYVVVILSLMLSTLCVTGVIVCFYFPV